LTNLYTITRLVPIYGGLQLHCSLDDDDIRIFRDLLVFTYIGFMAFKNVTPSPMILIGLTLSFSGAIYYSFNEEKKERRKELED